MAPNFTIGQFNNNGYAPWLGTCMPSFDFSTPNWGNSIYSFGSSSSSTGTSSSGRSDETFEEYKARLEKEAEEKAEKRRNLTSQKKLLETGASEYTTTYITPETNESVEVYADKDGKPLKFKVDEKGQLVIGSDGKPIIDENGQVMPVADQKSIEDKKKKAEAAKKDDGSATISMSAEEYEKKVPWWKRAIRAGGNALEGTFKMAKSLVGFDEKGKWNPVKCIKNVGILAAGVALTAVCPAAGPVLLYAGLAMGAAQVGKGVYKACTAKTVEEIDNAWQDVGVGAATAIASRAGIKGLGNSSGVSMSGVKLFTNAGSLIKAQPQSALTFSGGIKFSGSQFISNLKNLNPLQSKTKKDLQKAESDYVQVNLGMRDPALSAAEQDALLTHGIELEQKIQTLQTARMNEIINSPTKWFSKNNRAAIKNHTGKGCWKSYWESNTAGKGLLGKSTFVAKKAVKVGFQAIMPEFILWTPMTHSAFMVPFKSVDQFAYKQHYGDGQLNAFISPEAVQHLSSEEYKNYLSALTEQENALKNQLAEVDKQIESIA